MALVAMYVPVLVFAHAFAAFWLVKMLLIMYRPNRRQPKPGGALWMGELWGESWTTCALLAYTQGRHCRLAFTINTSIASPGPNTGQGNTKATDAPRHPKAPAAPPPSPPPATDDLRLAPDQRPPPSITAAGAAATAAPAAAAAAPPAVGAAATAWAAAGFGSAPSSALAADPQNQGPPLAATAAAAPAPRCYGDQEEDLTGDDSSDAAGPEDGRQLVGAVPSKDSQIILRRLTTHLRPLFLEWNDLGCSYQTSQGTKVVLEVRLVGWAVWGLLLLGC
jgi:hypothetical protein